MPGLNHLFQQATTGAVSEYATLEETLSPEVLDLIREWIASRFGPAALVRAAPEKPAVVGSGR
jgi:hypothetical protein